MPGEARFYSCLARALRVSRQRNFYACRYDCQVLVSTPASRDGDAALGGPNAAGQRDALRVLGGNSLANEALPHDIWHELPDDGHPVCTQALHAMPRPRLCTHTYCLHLEC